MKQLLQKILSVKNEKSHKVFTVIGFKFKFYNKKSEFEATKKQFKAIEKKLTLIDDEIKKVKKQTSGLYDVFYLPVKSKPWRNLKLALSDVSARETAEFIINNNMLNLPTFSDRLDLHTHALNHVEKEGLYLEFGVYKGKTLNHIASIKPDETIFGFDCFEGLPEAWYGDYTEGKFKLDGLPEVRDNAQLVVGLFNDTLPGFVKEHGDFDVAYMNIDCDLYSSTKTIFNCLKGHISSGTVIYFDEYFNYPGWQNHEYKAFMEFLAETGLNFEYLGYVYDKEKVAVRII